MINKDSLIINYSDWFHFKSENAKEAFFMFIAQQPKILFEGICVASLSDAITFMEGRCGLEKRKDVCFLPPQIAEKYKVKLGLID